MNGLRTYCMRLSFNNSSNCSSEIKCIVYHTYTTPKMLDDNENVEMCVCVCVLVLWRKNRWNRDSANAPSILDEIHCNPHFTIHKWIFSWWEPTESGFYLLHHLHFVKKGANMCVSLTVDEGGGGNDAFNKISSARFHGIIHSSVIWARIFREKRIQKSKEVEGKRQSVEESEEIGQRNDEKSPSFIFCDG